MDTEAFLLERQRLLDALGSHRALALEVSAARRKTFFGLPWSDWSHLLLSVSQRAGLGSWLPRVLVTTAIPFLIASIERKAGSILRPKSALSRLLAFLPLSRFGI